MAIGETGNFVACIFPPAPCQKVMGRWICACVDCGAVGDGGDSV